MPSEKRQLKVFLSYADTDRAAVHDLGSRLRRNGVDVWLKHEDLIPGYEPKIQIETKLRESDVVLICLSNQFNQNGLQQKELRFALSVAQEKPEGQIFIIPVQLKDSHIPPSLDKLHPVDLREPGAYKKLMRALKKCAEEIDAVIPETTETSETFTSGYQQNTENPPKPSSCSIQLIINLSILFALIGIFIVFVSPTILSVVSTFIHTPTPTSAITPTVTPTFTITPAYSLTPTQTATPTLASCPYQGKDDDESIRNLIQAEAEAANLGEDGMKITELIFSPYALIRDFAVPASEQPKKWAGPEAHEEYKKSHNTQVVGVIHFDIMPVGSGITGSLATYISGSMGKYTDDKTFTLTRFTNGSTKDYIISTGDVIKATQYGSEHWVLRKNSLGCWEIIQFDYDAGHIKFP